MKLTNIFPATTLPVRSGVYKTRAVNEDGKPDHEDWGFSYFDEIDRIWGCTANTVDEAWKVPGYEFAHQLKQWCGLAEEPTA